MHRFIKDAIAIAALIGASLASSTSQAQVWTPLTSGAERSVDFTAGGVFPIPKGIAVRGGSLRVLLVGGGSGGNAPSATCGGVPVQGGQGGDGGEVIEVDIPLEPGMCKDGLGVQIGAAGRGALRLGNGAFGETGGDTQITCQGQVIARALGGGRRSDAVSGTRSAKGGVGGAILNNAESSSNTKTDALLYSVHPAQSGQTGYLGYGSGGGGGGVLIATTGNVVQPDGTTKKQTTTRVAPRGRGGNGAGGGAGTDDFQGVGNTVPAENAALYGAGGGGGALVCAGPIGINRDGGHGHPGLARIKWKD